MKLLSLSTCSHWLNHPVRHDLHLTRQARADPHLASLHAVAVAFVDHVHVLAVCDRHQGLLGQPDALARILTLTSRPARG